MRNRVLAAIGLLHVIHLRCFAAHGYNEADVPVRQKKSYLSPLEESDASDRNYDQTTRFFRPTPVRFWSKTWGPSTTPGPQSSGIATTTLPSNWPNLAKTILPTPTILSVESLPVTSLEKPASSSSVSNSSLDRPDATQGSHLTATTIVIVIFVFVFAVALGIVLNHNWKKIRKTMLKTRDSMRSRMNRGTYKKLRVTDDFEEITVSTLS